MDNFTVPAVPKKISEITVSLEKVRVIGTVVDKRDGELIIDDKSGQITVVFDNPEDVKGIAVGSIVRVFGTPLVTESGVELHGQMIQQMSGLRIEIYEEAQKEWRRLEEDVRRLNDKG